MNVFIAAIEDLMAGRLVGRSARGKRRTTRNLTGRRPSKV